MKKFLFVGKVYPEESHLTVREIKVGELSGISDKHNHKIRIEVLNSIIRVDFETDAPIDLPTARNSVEYFVSGIIDSYGYYTGSAFDVTLTFGIGDEGEYTFPPVVNEIKNAQASRPVQPNQLLILSATFPRFHRALGDLREAIKHPMDTSFYCYRAIEAVRQHFLDKRETDDGKAKRKSWEKMANCLHFSKSFKDKLENESSHTRHGGIKDLTSDEVTEILQKAWTLVDRFAVYIQNGQKSLDPQIFEELH